MMNRETFFKWLDKSVDDDSPEWEFLHEFQNDNYSDITINFSGIEDNDEGDGDE